MIVPPHNVGSFYVWKWNFLDWLVSCLIVQNTFVYRLDDNAWIWKICDIFWNPRKWALQQGLVQNNIGNTNRKIVSVSNQRKIFQHPKQNRYLKQTPQSTKTSSKTSVVGVLVAYTDAPRNTSRHILRILESLVDRKVIEWMLKFQIIFLNSRLAHAGRSIIGTGTDRVSNTSRILYLMWWWLENNGFFNLRNRCDAVSTHLFRLWGYYGSTSSIWIETYHKHMINEDCIVVVSTLIEEYFQRRSHLCWHCEQKRTIHWRILTKRSN